MSMALCMKGREQRLSSRNRDKPFFPNRRSAVISIAVVAFLLLFAVFAIDRNNVSRLKRYRQDAEVSLDKGMDAMEERFMYTKTLVGLLDDTSLAEPFNALLSSYAAGDSPALVSDIYTALDVSLAKLQKQVFTHRQYPLYASYFEKIYAQEQAMVLHLDAYNDKARFYNMQIAAFPATIAAKRLGMQALELFSIAPAIKGRP